MATKYEAPPLLTAEAAGEILSVLHQQVNVGFPHVAKAAKWEAMLRAIAAGEVVALPRGIAALRPLATGSDGLPEKDLPTAGVYTQGEWPAKPPGASDAVDLGYRSTVL